MRAPLLLPALLTCLVCVSSSSTQNTAPPPLRADTILVEKAARRMSLLQQGQVLRTYRVALGPNPVGDKVRQGDGRTPEGRYTIDARNVNSAFHRSLHISYPDIRDRAEAAKQGRDPGGQIMIHGLANGSSWVGSAHTLSDWTLGCIAVTDAEIEEIWAAVPDGTPIEIRP